MSGKLLILKGKIGISIAVCATIALSGCDEGGAFKFPTLNNSSTDQTTQTTVQLVERDVEAPDAFQVTQDGLWDGTPSLGGVWVSHPDAREPERVIIRNQANGTFVIGALFPRAPENADAPLQVSSDAASALGILAQTPTQLQVTALRREEVTDTPDAVTTSEFDTPSDIAVTEIDSAPETTAAPAPVASPRPVVSTLDKPFIQLGIFSVEANATGTADRMRAIGIVPTVLQQTIQDRTFWRVIVGPATSEAERAQILAQVKSQGFEDAYFVTN